MVWPIHAIGIVVHHLSSSLVGPIRRVDPRMNHAVFSYYPIRERRGWLRLASSFSVLGVGIFGGNEDE